MNNHLNFDNKSVSIVGGGGHIGLPLSCFIQNKGFNVSIVDNNKQIIDLINNGKTSFYEDKLDDNLDIALRNGLQATNEIETIKNSEFVIITIGTSSSKESISFFKQLVDDVIINISDKSILILRSTVTVEDIDYILGNKIFSKKKLGLAYCPERIAEGKAFEELDKLPQIIGTNDEFIREVVENFFKDLDVKTISTTLENAVFIKLFSNAYRHANFSLANEFHNIAQKNKLDFEDIRKIATEDYPRLLNLPFSGYVGGPCLPKDLETFIKTYKVEDSLLNHLPTVNENYLDSIVERCISIFEDKSVIQLGLGFKINSDDVRGSGAVVLNNKLRDKGFKVFSVDPLINKSEFEHELFEFNEVKNKSKNILIAVNHELFKDYDLKNKKILYAEI